MRKGGWTGFESRASKSSICTRRSVSTSSPSSRRPVRISGKSASARRNPRTISLLRLGTSLLRDTNDLHRQHGCRSVRARRTEAPGQPCRRHTGSAVESVRTPMRITSRRKTIAFFVTLGVCLVGLAVALNVGWIILNWREGVMLFLGVIFFAVLIAGMIVNTSFLVREIRRNEQHDSFINAVTHELKTPIASIRLYLQTLQHRDV